jgi:alkylation response protein AidB-like acyl-CoA dehydrogenase
MLESRSERTIRELETSVPGPETSIGKLLLVTVEQAVFSLGYDLLGPARGLQIDFAPGEEVDRWTREYLYSRASSIYGGTSEIQRGIVAQRLLGLPRP